MLLDCKNVKHQNKFNKYLMCEREQKRDSGNVKGLKEEVKWAKDKYIFWYSPDLL